VLNRDSGTVSVIDTVTDAVIGSVSVDVGANYMFYDQHLNRLYVVSPVARQVRVLDVSASLPAALPTIDLGAGVSPPCPVGCVVASVTALLDGGRAYVVSYQQNGTCAVTSDTPPCVSTNVTVVSTTGNNIIKTINVDPGGTGEVTAVAACEAVRFRRFIVASADTSRVYVANCDGGDAAVIRTSDDTHLLDLTAPNGILSPTAPPGALPPPQNPVFILVGS
jgi:large repetitive protein